MKGRIVAVVAAAALASAARAQVDVRIAESAPGTALDWTGGAPPYDVVRVDLDGVAATPTSIDLGAATVIECASPDATTRAGFEDAVLPGPGRAFAYLVRGADYGSSSDGRIRIPASGDCSGGGRTVVEVCARWSADYPTNSTDVWTGMTTGCDEGVVDPVAIEDGFRRANLVRWLAGLPPIAENPTYTAKDQAAVVIQRGLGALNHFPSPGDPCYTTDGDEGSGSSNLAAGFRSLAASVDGWVLDAGVSTLGHRRWILYPPYAEGGFGYCEGGSFCCWSAMWVFGFGPDPAPEFVAWPPPGPFPDAAPLGAWSFSVDGASFASATVSVARVSDGAPMPVTNVADLPDGFGLETVSWNVAGVAADEEYDVTVDGVTGAPRPTYAYRVRVVTCP